MQVNVGHRLQQIRVLNGWSQRELAKRAGVTNSTISMIEQGRVSPSVASLEKVLNGIPMTLEYFFNMTLTPRSPVVYHAEDWSDAEKETITSSQLILGGDIQKTLSFARVSYPPDCRVSCMSSRGADEAGLIISGELTLAMVDLCRFLRAGDTYYLSINQPFLLHNTSTQACVVIKTHVFT